MQLQPAASGRTVTRRAPSRLLYLLRAVVHVGLPYFSRPALDDCVTEHRDDHDKQEVACVHQVKVDERAVVLEMKKTKQKQKKQGGLKSQKRNNNDFK